MPPPIAAPANGLPTAAPMIAPVAAPTPVPMNVPFSRVERGSPEHPTAATIAMAPSRPLINAATFVRTCILLPHWSSFHTCRRLRHFTQPTAGAFLFQPLVFYLPRGRSTIFQILTVALEF